MDRRQARRLKRGELPIDAHLDLHGLTIARAHGALSAFIKRAHAAGARLVVVITGKGPDGRGRIRAEAPHWLNAAELRPLILAVTQAHGSHGGAGALYVLLKRRRERHGD
jgi:DNA-nicking Smr family endonuclease